MNWRSKRLWLWQIFGTAGPVFLWQLAAGTNAAVFLVSLVVTWSAAGYIHTLDSMLESKTMGGPCVHCGGARVLHLPPPPGEVDGICICATPHGVCPCLEYRTANWWLKEDF